MMMKKPTKEQIAMHVAYRVQVVHWDGLSVIDTDATQNNEDAFCTQYSLLLRPLSQLTEEIEHEGERFVPIEILWRMAVDGRYNPFEKNKHDYKGSFDLKVKNESGVDIIIYTPDDERHSRLEVSFSSGEVSFFQGSSMDAGCLDGVFNQFLLFQKLLEWQFNVFEIECVDWNEFFGEEDGDEK